MKKLLSGAPLFVRGHRNTIKLMIFCLLGKYENVLLLNQFDLRLELILLE